MPPTPQAAHPEPPPTTLEPPPHPIPARSYWITRLIQIPLMALSTAFFGSISLICGLWDTSGRQQHRIARTWARTLLLFAHSPVEVVGAEKFRAFAAAAKTGNGAAVYAANHLSYMDTPVLFAKLPFQFRILAKGGLWKVPFVGWYLHRSGQVPIHSGSPRSLIAGLLRGVKALQAGMPLVVFPEGARTPDGRMQASASGGAFMAIRAGVPLVPLALIGTYELLPIHVYSLRPRPLKIIVGDPIPTAHLTTRDADALTARLYTEITRLYNQYSF